ncbi:type II toxin-antitoxin system prevent-host-death family antitoxin [Streptomyces regalis]|uniref:type II toxin-antitoxin system prevent-host-death family antitoxin n=1 Tax=Streptomyces regalis TaxID=68262 RepID=UPI00099EBEC4
MVSSTGRSDPALYIPHTTNTRGHAVKIAASEAKAVLGSLVREAEQGNVVELTRYGRTAAVLISAEQWERAKRILFSENGN